MMYCIAFKAYRVEDAVKLFSYDRFEVLFEIIFIKGHRGGSMKVTIHPYTIILTKAQRDAVSMIEKGRIVA